MLDLLQTAHSILVKGKIDGPQLELLRQQLYADGSIDRPKANVLVRLHQRVNPQTPAFERLFYQALKDHLLARERLGAEETKWLRETIFADGEFKDEERKFLHELKGEAKQCGPEFEMLFKQSMMLPHEQRTCC